MLAEVHEVHTCMYTRSFCFLPGTGTRSMWCSYIHVSLSKAQLVSHTYVGRLTKQISYVQGFQERYVPLLTHHFPSEATDVGPQLQEPQWILLGDTLIDLSMTSSSCVVNTILQPEYCSHSTKQGLWVGSHLRIEQSFCTVMQTVCYLWMALSWFVQDSYTCIMC